MTMWTNLTEVAFVNAEPRGDLGAVEARGDQEGCAFLGGVGGPERRHDVGFVPTGWRRMLDEQSPDRLAEPLAADCVGQSAQRVRADPGAVDERGDHRFPRQRCAAEDARVQDGWIDAVGANERTPLVIR